MLLIATSDKGGTGRSVTGCNVAYRRALQGVNVCYVDFDFGSPTSGAIFDASRVAHGTASHRGTHSYLLGTSARYEECNIWDASDRQSLRARPPGSGRLVLVPGDAGGGEFASSPDAVSRCIRLLADLEEQFDLTIVDLSAGRSYAAEIVAEATGSAELAGRTCRWLVFHRWTRQHIIAAGGLVYGPNGLHALVRQLAKARRYVRDPDEFLHSVRFVRTAVMDPRSRDVAGLSPAQHAWLRERNRELVELATRLKLGLPAAVGIVPLDPVLQWDEQLITDDDIWTKHVANVATVKAFEAMAVALDDPRAWEPP